MSGSGRRFRSIVVALAILVATVLTGAAPASAIPVTGQISGIVTGDDGALEHILVKASLIGGSGGEVSTWTDADGAYTLTGVSPGSYTVTFEDDTERYVSASRAVVVDDVTVTVDVVLVLAGHIAGTVTDVDGNGITGITATAYEWDTVTDSLKPGTGRSKVTGPDGKYQIDGFAPGRYRIEFTDAQGDFVPQPLQDSPDITVTAGPAIQTVDAVLAPGHHIKGTVTGGGAGLPNIMVAAYADDAPSFTSAGVTYTGAGGSYDLGGLPAGDYRLCFDGSRSGWAFECFDGAADLQHATVLHVTADGSSPQADAELAAATRISGTVTGPGNVAADGVPVLAYRRSDAGTWVFATSSVTGADGTYSVIGLAPGVYRLSFAEHSVPAYVGEFWQDASSIDAANDIDLSDGTPATGVDAQLATGGHITGTVTGPNGDPLAGIYVNAVRSNGDLASPGFAATDAQGHYDIGGLAAGDYTVSFVSPTQGYVQEFWPDAHLPATGTPVTVTEGGTTGAIDAQLDQAGSLSGTVTGPAGQPVKDVAVTVLSQDSDSRWGMANGTLTQADGTYVLGALLPGTYRVQFRDLSGAGYLTEFWDDARTVAGAQDVEVTVGATTGGIDARLARPAPVTPSISNLAVPTISGDAVAGRPLTAGPGRWSPSDGLSFSYQWLVDDVAVPGATAATYLPTASDAGRRVRVEVTASRPGYTSAKTTSAPTDAITLPVATFVTNPSITSGPSVGQPVRALPGVWTPANATARIQWLIDGVPVPAATGATYTPRPVDAGRSLQVQVAVTAPGFEPTTATSAPAVVGLGTMSAVDKPRLAGRAQPGGVLRVVAGGWPGTAAVHYRWSVDGERIRRTTGERLHLTRALVRTHFGERDQLAVRQRGKVREVYPLGEAASADVSQAHGPIQR